MATERIGCFEFRGEGESLQVISFHERFMREKHMAANIRRRLVQLLEDVMYTVAASIGVSPEQVHLGEFRYDARKSFDEAMVSMMYRLHPRDLYHLEQEFIRIQQRIDPEAPPIALFHSKERTFTYAMKPIIEEMFRRLRCGRALADHRRRVRLLATTQRAREFIEARIVLDMQRGRISRESFSAFTLARNPHQGLRCLFSKPSLVAMDEEIRLRANDGSSNTLCSLVTNTQKGVELSPEGAFLFEEIVFRALRRPNLFPQLMPFHKAA